MSYAKNWVQSYIQNEPLDLTFFTCSGSKIELSRKTLSQGLMICLTRLCDLRSAVFSQYSAQACEHHVCGCKNNCVCLMQE